MEDPGFDIERSAKKIQDTLQYEGKLYFIAAGVMAVIAVIVGIIFWLGGVVFALVTLYLIYLGIRNKKGAADLFEATLVKKTYKKGSLIDGDDAQKLNFERFEFLVKVRQLHVVGPGKIDHKDASGTKTVIVNKALYDHFQPGNEFNYLISPALDLIGYADGGTLFLAEGPEKEQNAELNKLKIAVDQDEQRNRFSWKTFEVIGEIDNQGENQ